MNLKCYHTIPITFLNQAVVRTVLLHKEKCSDFYVITIFYLFIHMVTSQGNLN